MEQTIHGVGNLLLVGQIDSLRARIDRGGAWRESQAAAILSSLDQLRLRLNRVDEPLTTLDQEFRNLRDYVDLPSCPEDPESCSETCDCFECQTSHEFI